MKIFKHINIIALMILLSSCGLKSYVVPKGSFDIPYPTNIDYAINSEGVSIYNGSDNYTLFVERADESIGFINLSGYKRVALINPKQTYTDEGVINNRIYKYRFRHYNGRVKTYSPAVVRTVKYYKPIKHDIIKTTFEKNNVCLYLGLSDRVDRTEVNINGVMVGNAKNGLKTCFNNYPNTSVNLVITAIPYDSDNNTGIPYKTTIKRNASSLNLPPQNIQVRRNGNDIVIVWDKEKNSPKYNIYLVEKGKDRFYKQIDIELFRYTAKTDNCVEFKISTVRRGKESKRISVSACK